MSDWTPAQLDALSATTQADVPEADAAWRTDAPKVAKPLLDATEDEAEPG
jgi:hypothetical protein